jgi:FlaA1/EpsC-like NDP-sugar epimerase
MPNLGELLRGEQRATALHEVDVADVLGRPAVVADLEHCRAFVRDRRVLITGAAGSIGQELTRQVASLDPAELVLLDTNETGLFDLCQELELAGAPSVLCPIVASVTNPKRLAVLFDAYRPEIVFHAAAYKHVPLMEAHPQEAVMVNAIGTLRVARAAAAAGVARFVLVSTDKAVRPSSVMGAAKRVAELAVKAVAAETGLSACCVRFGNVLGSRGSVIPIFSRQIDAGGPVTVTDPRMKRFFMTIPEAVGLIIQAGAYGDRDAIYLLDMGEEVSILDLAKRMIRLHGLEVGRDIEIAFTGLRPGEKLREELSLQTEVSRPTDHAKIAILEEPARALADLGLVLAALDVLAAVVHEQQPPQIREALFAIVRHADGAVSAESVDLPTPRPLPAPVPTLTSGLLPEFPLPLVPAADLPTALEQTAMRLAGA